MSLRTVKGGTTGESILIEVDADGQQLIKSGAWDNLAGYQALTVSSTAVSLTVPATAKKAHFFVETAPIRVRDDGTDPTAAATGGIPLYAGDAWDNYDGDLSKFRAIRSTGVDAVLHVSYYV